MLATSQQFCVKWNSYSSNLQNVFPRLLTSEHFVDITLACEGQMIKCHKVVLSACSTYFENLLVHNPCQHPIIFMKDMKHWEVQALVDFMYKGEVNVSQEELNSLLVAAEALQIRGLCGSDQSSTEKQQNLPKQLVDENRLPAVSLPHDTVLSGRETPPFKRRRNVAEDQEQTSNKVVKNNRTSLGPTSSSTMEVNSLPVTAAPSNCNTSSETDTYSDHVENKKAVKQELDLDHSYLEGEIEADGADEDYSLEHQDDSDSNNREDALPTSPVDQPGPSGLVSNQGIATLNKATTAVKSGLPLDMHSTLNYTNVLLMRPPHKQYSPKALNQAVEDFQTGKFNSIRACARHHGVPMTTLHYRVKLKLKRSEWADAILLMEKEENNIRQRTYRRIKHKKKDMNTAMALQNVMCVLSPSDQGKMPTPSWKEGSIAPTRIRRSEAELTKAAECVQKGMTFQNVSDIFNIPISTIRFYMARRGILPQRRRGRTASTQHSNSGSSQFMMMHYKLEDINKKQSTQ